jgi:hypothetical protein
VIKLVSGVHDTSEKRVYPVVASSEIHRKKPTASLNTLDKRFRFSFIRQIIKRYLFSPIITEISLFTKTPRQLVRCKNTKNVRPRGVRKSPTFIDYSYGLVQPGERSLIMICVLHLSLDGDNLKEWECVQLNHHKDVGRTIEQWQRNGWRLHTYTCAQIQPSAIYHYLLFERGSPE